MSNKVDTGGGCSLDSMADVRNIFFGVGDFFWGLLAEGVIVPLSARNLVDEAIIITRIALKGGFVLWAETWVD